MNTEPTMRPDFDAVRADFPRARTAAYFDNASSHPLSVHSTAALHRYVEWLSHDVGEPWWPNWAGTRDDSKALFARLINADPGEIAHGRSTVETESNLLNGMTDHLAGGNIVTCDLSFSANLYNYKMRERDGHDVRNVPQRDRQIDKAAQEQAIDANTRRVSNALVSNVNGFVADIASLSDLAHARGAYLYADIMQAAGAVPIDVRASGIDMAACSTFKWLMGVKGFGYVYVRADLQGTVVAPTQHAGGVSFNYEPWIDDPDATRPAVDFRPTEGPGRYEVSYPSYEGAVCAQQSLQYIERLGVANIRAHARELTDRLHDELPRLGYDSITPRDNDSPILSFVSPDPGQTVSRCQEAGVHVAMRFGNKLRLAPSVYNNHEDVDQLLSALT